MRKSQNYLGIPNAIVLCIDQIDDKIHGRFYHRYQKQEICFNDELECLLKMEELYDELRFPFPGNNERHFIQEERPYMKEEEKTVVNEDEELLDKHDDLGTFIVRVQHRQNSSWQGRITWVEEDKTLYFRSVWEMMKLIDEAMEEHKKKEEETPSWK